MGLSKLHLSRVAIDENQNDISGGILVLWTRGTTALFRAENKLFPLVWQDHFRHRPRMREESVGKGSAEKRKHPKSDQVDAE